MFKKLFFLSLFVLLVGLSSAAQAEPIDVNNHSFEYDVNGEYFTTIDLDDLQGWTLRDTTGWAAGWNWVTTDLVFGGVEVEGYEAADGNAAVFSITWHDPEDANEHCVLIQILDPNLDADAVIAENRRYTLTFNALRCSVLETPDVYGALFYSEGGVNIPPANDVILASVAKTLTWPTWDEPGYAGWEEVTVNYTALSAAPSIGKRLGIQLAIAFPWTAGTWAATDNVRVEWTWATNAWEPSPADGADEVPIDVTLSWRPGVWAQSTDGQEVYFGTSFNDVDNATTATSGVFQVAQDGNSWSVLNYDANGLDLGAIYYWRIDEVNTTYSGTSPPTPPAGRWKGEVWSFEVEGRAKNPTPEDEAIDIPFLDLTVSWEAGRDALTHDVYFGNNYDDVNDANTSSGPALFRGNQGGLSYYVTESSGGLDIGRTYYWRIDEHTASETIPGHVWSFTVGDFLIVDDMESYIVVVNNIYSTWVDGGGALVGLIYNDPNYMREPDSQSMEFEYDNTKSGPSCRSSYADANPAELAIGTDWTIGGVKSITLFWLGDPGNVIPTQGPNPDYDAVRLWVELEDTGAQTHLVKYGDVNDIDVNEWHQWDISLEDYNSAGVNLSSLARVTIGIGGTTETGQSVASEGTIWIDDIRLYPPRCIPELAHMAGNFNDDCQVEGLDLEIMSDEWLKSGMWADAAPPVDPPEVWYRFDKGGPGETVVKNDGSWGSDYDIPISSPNAVDEPNWTTDVALVLDPCDPNYALEFDGLLYTADGDYLEIPNLPATNFAGTQNMTITAWIKGPIPQATSYTAFICSAQASGDRHATGLGFGVGADRFNYFWNNNYWDWQPEPPLLITDDLWTFMAIAVEPTQATAYVYDGTLSQATNAAAHGPLEDFDTDCWSVIGSAAQTTNGYFEGIIDDVRLYNKTLTVGEVMGVAGVEGEVYLPLDSIADLVVGIKDPNNSGEPIDDQIDFRDYAVLGDNWLDEILWP